MKTLSRLAVGAVTLFATAHAEMVHGYLRDSGTYVAPYYRTLANGTPYDNLNYLGFPSQQPGDGSATINSSGFSSGRGCRWADYSDSFKQPSRLPAYDTSNGGLQTLSDTR